MFYLFIGHEEELPDSLKLCREILVQSMTILNDEQVIL